VKAVISVSSGVGESDLKLARTGVKVLLPVPLGKLYLAGTLGIVVGVHFFVMNAS